MRSLAALHDDRRFELFVANELTAEWVSLGQRVAGTIVVTEDDPLSALGYAITAGMTGPFVIVMGKRYKADQPDLLAAGADACLLMPVAARDLDRVARLFAKHAAVTSIDSTLRLLLDPITRSVRFQDKCVRLSQREFAVLHCMSAGKGRPVSAEHLLTYVWGDAPSSDRTRQILDVYIFQVRKKLDRLGLKGAIATVRGFGYALVHVTKDTH
jgi:DNA-binding response OmpR family regulator